METGAQYRNQAKVHEVGRLFWSNQADKAMEIIYKAAELTEDEKEWIGVGHIGKAVWEKVKSKSLTQMLVIKKSYENMKALRQKYNPPHDAEVQRCLSELETSLPYLRKEEQAQVKIFQAYCHSYLRPRDDQKRYELLMEAIRLVPKNSSVAGRVLSSCAMEMKYCDYDPDRQMAIPEEKRYECFKAIYAKLPADHSARETYAPDFNRAARFAFSCYVSQGQNEQNDVEKRCLAYQKAIDTVDDFYFSKEELGITPNTRPKMALKKEEEKRNSYKLAMYGKLIPLLKLMPTKDDYFKRAEKQQNLIFRQATLQKQIRGIWTVSQDYN